MVQRYVNKLPNDVIISKWLLVVIEISNNLNNLTVMVRFIQAISIVHFQLEDLEFITKLNEQLSNFEFVKRPVESSLSICSML